MVPSVTSTKYSLDSGAATKGGLVDSIMPHQDQTTHKKDRWKDGDWPIRNARNESNIGWSKHRPRRSISDDEDLSSPSPPNPHHLSKAVPATGGVVKEIKLSGPDEIEKVTEQLLDGFVDLRNTVDEDKDVRYAPGTFSLLSHRYSLLVLPLSSTPRT